MRAEINALRRVGESALRVIAAAFDDESNPPSEDDAKVEATIVFADIEGFSDLVARRGDDAAEALLDALDLAVADALEGTSGRVVKRLGDGVMLVSDDAEAGVRIAASLPVRFANRVRRLPDRPRLRAGAHRGEMRTRGADLFGYHVNVAARVTEDADGGQALITEALLDAALTQPPLLVRPAGVLVAKGVPERPPLYAVAPVVTAATD